MSEIVRSDADEIEVIQTCAGLIAQLQEDAAARVALYLAARFGSTGLQGTVAASLSTGIASGLNNDSVRIPTNDMDLPDAFANADPGSQLDKAMIVAYYLQLNEFPDGWDSGTVNTQLKDMGHRIANITNVMTQAMRLKPQLVIQIRKSGKSQQARKIYRLTTEGKKYVERLLNGEARGSDDA